MTKTLKEEYWQKVREVSNDMDFNSVGESKIHDFGYHVIDDYHEMHTVTDFGNIWNWFEQALKSSQIEILRKFVYYADNPKLSGVDKTLTAIMEQFIKELPNSSEDGKPSESLNK